MRVALAGGGTGGHVLPLVSLAEAMKAGGGFAAPLFLGADGLEGRLLGDAGHRFVRLPVGRVRGVSRGRQVRGALGMAAAVPMAMAHLLQNDIQVVVGSGGYASAPAVVAAVLSRIPVVLLEQNTIPGSTNRALARMARVVCTSYGESSKWLPEGKVELTGNPVRRSILEIRERRSSMLADGSLLNGDRPLRLLVLGGSQGAAFLNGTVATLLGSLCREHGGLEVVHQCGTGRLGEVGGAYAGAGEARVVEYVERMDELLLWADLVVGRAGATTLAELSVAGLPALLVPFPHATDNHQEFNARHYERAGAALVFVQAEFDSEAFSRTVLGLRDQRDRLAPMVTGSLASGIPDAAQRVMRVVEGLA